MKTIFDKANREELITRINTLNENSEPQWGKMNLYQMVTHCAMWEEWILGKTNTAYKQAFIGILFGKKALKSVTENDDPLRRNSPTVTKFIIKEKNGDIDLAKKKWIALIEDYAQFSNPDLIHDFFGKMTKEQIGILAYKHTDHHLRQFKS